MTFAERLDPDQLARLGGLSVKARFIVEGALSGLHRSRLHGSSVEFAEHKEYSPGDELRHLDWKAYAKLDRYYVKQFEQESQLTIHLVFDASASMKFSSGGLTKLEYAGLFLAAVAHLAIGQRDAVGLVACGDRSVETIVPPRTGSAHLHQLFGVFDQIISAGGKGDQSPAAALAHIAESSRRSRALVILASDLFDPADETVGRLCALSAQRHDVVVVHVLDPYERTFPYQGLTEFRSLESGATMLANPAAIRKTYIERMNAFCSACKHTLTHAGVEYHEIATDRPLDQSLLELLSTRAALRPGQRRKAG